ncbi:saccharopine dehydrogenase NADP-binding domain-containing protein [Siccirubricoccus sp. KC 17139]|uniref:Saccharopine dehydrogenase NADP-binding domain-containing protein n=1 Tax=Siccirubricoccus soli TaxID=2899147 RepID=A0ABT1CZB6_9PROT|nr:saccharopine dehydrogenase C-terminal domain-containing protein [Siccirubricoccus soli]MCO6415002.1 saccharopine dehydrogenase NADP-binding domain-containing protein [Siccirubricoccus soli]MCP2681133.1 saccharopine dehydrogenase NADP-binding domain-containing protein [Siccirubricoccus soli]
MIHASFSGRLVMLGFGSIGQGVLPLILRHIDMPRDRITIVTAEPRGREIAAEYGIRFVQQPVTRENYKDVLVPELRRGDFLLNLSVDVSSVALIALCQEIGALYLDTCIEPWAGGYTDPSLTPSQRSNYALRESARALRDGVKGRPTAVLTHGANPGLVSHLVKEALLNLARDLELDVVVPTDREGWAALAERLGVKVIHIAERDTQVADRPKARGEFVNTWSIDGFVGEGCQPAELGWGTHEKALPPDGNRHEFGCDAAIWLARPGASTRVRSWTPLEGPFHGFLITHNEAISLADYYTVRDAAGAVRYRPTAHYAYHPCDDAVLSVHEIAGKNWEMQPQKRLMMEEITSGIDELGVLLMGHEKGAYWYGSRLSIEQARALAPHNNATSLQVTAAVLAGLVWAIENPRAGIVEADEIDHARCMEIMRPYLGEVVGEYSDWTPLQDREQLFPEELDRQDPWQFKNFRVV